MQPHYDDLDPDAARAFRLMSLHTGPDFTAGAAAALLDTDGTAAREMLATLTGEGLLTAASPGRWHFPGSAGQFAREAAVTEDTPEERNAATGRVIDYYLRASAAADLLINPHRLRIAAAFGLPALHPPAYVGPAAALAWFDAEQANLLQAQQTAASLALHTLAWQFCETTWGWCTRRHNFPAWEDLCQTAIESAHACDDARAVVTAMVRLASCHLARGSTRAAATLAGEAIRTAWANGDRAGEGSAREHAAMCALADNDYPAAIEHCTRGLACWRHISSRRRPEALLERLLGRAYAGLGDDQQAIAHLSSALATFTALEERYHQARTLQWLAAVYLTGHPAIEDIEEAITLLDRARPLLQAEDHLPSLADLLIMLADAHTQLGNTSPASACIQEAIAHHQRLNLPADHPARARADTLARQLTATSGPLDAG